MMTGPPGAGKSTLSGALAAALRKLGAGVDFLSEDAIFSRHEWADVAEAFRARAWPSCELILDAYARLLDTWRGSRSWAVFDGDCLSLIEDLPCAQPDGSGPTTLMPEVPADFGVLVAHAKRVLSLWSELDPLLLVLRVRTEEATRRAVAQRGPDWGGAYAGAMPQQHPAETNLDRILRYLRTGRHRREAIRDAFGAAGWPVATIDAAQTPDRVLAAALEVLS